MGALFFVAVVVAIVWSVHHRRSRTPTVIPWTPPNTELARLQYQALYWYQGCLAMARQLDRLDHDPSIWLAAEERARIQALVAQFYGQGG